MSSFEPGHQVAPQQDVAVNIESSGDLLANVDEENAALRDIAKRILELDAGAPLPKELMQEALTSLTRMYTVSHQLGERWSPFTGDRPMPPTAVMIMSTAMMRSVNVELFELGMWQAWAGA